MSETRTVRLGDVAEINPKGDKLASDTNVSFIGMADLDASKAEGLENSVRQFSEVSKGYTQFRRGDILVAKITPCWENGKIGIANISQPHGAGSTEFHIVRPHENIDTRYLLHKLRDPQVNALGTIRMTGSAGQRRIPANFISNLKINLPNLEEQKKYAFIKDLQMEIAQKRERQQELYTELERSLFISIFGNPETWSNKFEMTTIGDLAESTQYGTSAKAGATGEYPVLRMGNITDDGKLDLSDLKYMDLSPKEVDKYTVQRGDMLFNRTNSKEKVGKAAVVMTDQKLAYAGYLVRVRFRNPDYAHFVAAFLNSDYGRRLRQKLAKTAVNQANINAHELSKIEIKPPQGNTVQQFTTILNNFYENF